MGKTYGVRDVANLTFIDLVSNKPFFYMDYALATTNEHTAEAVYARGGSGNPKRIRFDGNRESTLKISTQIIDFRLIAMLSGAEVVKGSKNVFQREVLTLQTNKLTLTKTPIADSVTIFPLEKDCDETAIVTATISDKDASITSGTAGAQYAVYYQSAGTATCESITFRADTFPKACKIVGDTLIKNEETDELEPFQMEVYKASPNAAFTLSFASSGDPLNFEITMDIFADAHGNMITYTIAK